MDHRPGVRHIRCMILRNINKPLNFQWAFKVAMLGFQNLFILIFSFTALQYCVLILSMHIKKCVWSHTHISLSADSQNGLNVRVLITVNFEEQIYMYLFQTNLASCSISLNTLSKQSRCLRYM